MHLKNADPQHCFTILYVGRGEGEGLASQEPAIDGECDTVHHGREVA
jgi:hypothetical protein